jgi:hypothetical protein
MRSSPRRTLRCCWRRSSDRLIPPRFRCWANRFPAGCPTWHCRRPTGPHPERLRKNGGKRRIDSLRPISLNTSQYGRAGPRRDPNPLFKHTPTLNRNQALATAQARSVSPALFRPCPRRPEPALPPAAGEGEEETMKKTTHNAKKHGHRRGLLRCRVGACEPIAASCQRLASRSLRRASGSAGHARDPRRSRCPRRRPRISDCVASLPRRWVPALWGSTWGTLRSRSRDRRRRHDALDDGLRPVPARPFVLARSTLESISPTERFIEFALSPQGRHCSCRAASSTSAGQMATSPRRRVPTRCNVTICAPLRD